MKNIVKLFTCALFATFVLASCETYKLPETEYTNVSWLDGKYVCFATDADGAKCVFFIEITNTADNALDKAWVTITNLDVMESWYSLYYGVLSAGGSQAAAEYYANNRAGYLLSMAAYRFPVSCDASSKTFSCSNVAGEEPYTCYNPVLQGSGAGPQGYYTGSGYFDGFREFTISLSNGAITSGVPTASGKTTDGISFSVTIQDNINEEFSRSYTVEGIRQTGWAEDTAEYSDLFYSQFED